MKSLETYINEKMINNNINEDLVYYDNIIDQLKECKEKQIPLDEGLFKALFGGIGGATIGPPLMKGVCKVLGIDEKGSMGSLMTSRLTLAALGSYLGWKN